MTADQIFVGSIAIVLSIVTTIAALGYLPAAFELGLAKRIQQRYGQRGAARFYWLVSALLFALGLVILCDVRPSFAVPEAEREQMIAGDSDGESQ
ncbi:hypothetical protein [Rosistilla oblonga]|uniref:hypothetical protein n=1 Tax=Rosistilla oblonga TaxID=2527990 RepID=UPI003A97A922